MRSLGPKSKTNNLCGISYANFFNVFSGHCFRKVRRVIVPLFGLRFQNFSIRVHDTYWHSFQILVENCSISSFPKFWPKFCNELFFRDTIWFGLSDFGCERFIITFFLHKRRHRINTTKFLFQIKYDKVERVESRNPDHWLLLKLLNIFRVRKIENFFDTKISSSWKFYFCIIVSV